MDLDNVVKFFAPKGMHISESVRATASEQLTVTDVMAALGMTQADAGIGLAPGQLCQQCRYLGRGKELTGLFTRLAREGRDQIHIGISNHIAIFKVRRYEI